MLALGPVAFAYTIVIWTIVYLCFRAAGRANNVHGVCLALSSAFAITATDIGVPSIMGFSLGLCAVIAIYGRTLASLAIAFLYAVRLVLFGVANFGWVPEYILWELNFLPLTLQMIIALGGSIHHHIRDRSDNFAGYFYRINAYMMHRV